jgi:hypothetical protein
MRALRLFLVALLGSVIALSTCGVIEFSMYLVFLPFEKDYQTWLITFFVINLVSFAVLSWGLNRFPVAAAAVGAGAGIHLLLYALRWGNRSQMLATGIAIDALIVFGAILTAFLSSKMTVWAKLGKSTSIEPKPLTSSKGFWSSLDQASRVAIITSLITALAGIVTTTISVVFKR